MTAEDNETPVTARNRVRRVGSDLVRAEMDLKAARDAEVNAKHDYEKAKRAAALSPDAPRVVRGGTTVAEREAWVDERCDSLEFQYRLAEATRQAAKDHYDTINTQAMLSQAILKSIDAAFRMGTRDDA